MQEAEPDASMQIASLIQQSQDQTMQMIAMLAESMQQQTQAMTRPRTATLSDGRQIVVN